MVWEINMGVCPRLEFDNIIMFINCLGYDFYIYGAFEFLCNSIDSLTSCMISQYLRGYIYNHF